MYNPYNLFEYQNTTSYFFKQRNYIVFYLLFTFTGECKIAEADKTLSFSAFTDRKSGVSGKLFVTNFKVSFVTEDRSSYEGVKILSY